MNAAAAVLLLLLLLSAPPPPPLPPLLPPTTTMTTPPPPPPPPPTTTTPPPTTTTPPPVSYFVGLVFTLIYGADNFGGQEALAAQTAVAFRLILALGAVPSAVVVGLLVKIKLAERCSLVSPGPLEETSGIFGTTSKHARNGSEPYLEQLPSLDGSSAEEPKAGLTTFASIMRNPSFFSYLVATGGCWFLCVAWRGVAWCGVAWRGVRHCPPVCGRMHVR
jgi:hypothetical protein